MGVSVSFSRLRAEEDYGTNDNMLACSSRTRVTTNTYPGSLKLRVGNLTKGKYRLQHAENNIPVEYATNLVPNAWYYFAMTYDEKREYARGLRVFWSGRRHPHYQPRSIPPTPPWWVTMAGSSWATRSRLHAITNNAFRNPGEGAIDEFAIWHDELSPAEIRAQFAAMAPAVSPTLTILQAGSDVILSWPSQHSEQFRAGKH